MFSCDARRARALAVRGTVDTRATVQTVCLCGVAPLRVADTVNAARPTEIAVAFES